MLKYLIILLDDTAPSFCHYSNQKSERNLISEDNLKNGIVWAMKENLMVQFVYPDYELPKEHLNLIDSVDHIDIKGENADADVSIFEGNDAISKLKDTEYSHVVLQLSKEELFSSLDEIKAVIRTQPSLNIVIRDIESSSEDDFAKYGEFLEGISPVIIDKIKTGATLNFNLLTDRLLLIGMNNCNAGDESITLAPDGNFYVCPGFYFDGDENVGNPLTGLSIPNAQLYKLENAPICRNCDAYQCKRCVWLNQKTTLEVNTPSRQQCIVAHIERNASRKLLMKLKEGGIFKFNKTIPEIDYLDPFDKIKR